MSSSIIKVVNLSPGHVKLTDFEQYTVVENKDHLKFSVPS